MPHVVHVIDHVKYANHVISYVSNHVISHKFECENGIALALLQENPNNTIQKPNSISRKVLIQSTLRIQILSHSEDPCDFGIKTRNLQFFGRVTSNEPGSPRLRTNTLGLADPPPNGPNEDDNFSSIQEIESMELEENDGGCCRGIDNFELWGAAVKWDSDFKFNSSIECCEACKAMCNGKDGPCLCDSCKGIDNFEMCKAIFWFPKTT
ncbi:hypothetical protein LXL04_032773 [Taraxacum kok-saghyz]